MKIYWNIFKRILKLNFALLLAYRTSFVWSTLTTVAWGFFQIVWVLLLTHNVKSVFGWTRNEMILIAASYNIIIAIFHFLFSRNFDRFSYMVDRGDLDILLVKPVESQFLVSFWIISYPNVVRILVSLLALVYLLIKMHIIVSLSNIIGFLALTVFSIILLYAIWFLVSTLIIWFPRLSNLVDILYNLNGISRLPPDIIYGLRSFMLLFLIPFALTIAIPTKALINKVLGGDILQLVLISVILFWLSRRFWRFALRYYTSASS